MPCTKLMKDLKTTKIDAFITTRFFVLAN